MERAKEQVAAEMAARSKAKQNEEVIKYINSTTNQNTWNAKKAQPVYRCIYTVCIIFYTFHHMKIEKIRLFASGVCVCVLSLIHI